MKKITGIGFKIAGGLFLCQALYSFVTTLSQEAYLDQLQMAVLFFIASQMYETKTPSNSG
ncbi:hypothetical protein [Alteromonas sp. 14N.309.X.WAT.G.H12]|uniref:hypothetical protein n=1 Tax=Alteromonas sp. 14N.309.X.WAT.G.H12 TaxID=3120824 RepID=UPI002FD51250